MREDLRDPRGKLLARLKTLNTGQTEIRDARGKLLGTFDPKKNETRDAHGKLVGRGNLLSALIVSEPR
jgi:hypothetical protein